MDWTTPCLIRHPASGSGNFSGNDAPTSPRVDSMSIDGKQLHSVFDQDGGAILDIDAGLISRLNPTGAFVWQRLQRGEPVEVIVTSLSQETNESEAKVERDVHDFIEELKRNHLLPS
jgi:hypothetical protein